MAVTALQRPDFRTIATFRRRIWRRCAPCFSRCWPCVGGRAWCGWATWPWTAPRSARTPRSISDELPSDARERTGVGRGSGALAGRGRGDRHPRGWRARAGAAGDELPAWVANKQEKLAKIRAAKRRWRPKPGPRGRPTRRPRRRRRRRSAIHRPRESDHEGPGRLCAGLQRADRRGRRQSSDRGRACHGGRHRCPGAANAAGADQSEHRRQAQEVSADAGYCSTANLQALQRRHIRGYIAVGRQRHGQPAPEGARPLPPGSLVRRCGPGSSARAPQSLPPAQDHRGTGLRADEGGAGFRQFALRGLAKVQGEFTLLATAHNMLKLAAARPT